MSEWIACNDRLPGSGNVLAYAPGNVNGDLGPIQTVGANSVLWWHQNYPNSMFTHWMPLPQPPVSEEKP